MPLKMFSAGTGTFSVLKSDIFRDIENLHIFAPNVSSERPRRNNSPYARNHFPLFVQTSRNAGSLTISGNEAPHKRRYREPVMQNVIAINPAARQSIIIAQTTSDETLLRGIAD